MSEYLIKDTTLTGIADAIRGKTGGTDPVAVSDMAAQIEGIQAGGGDGRFVVNLMINDDGVTYKADKTFAEVVSAYDNGQVVDAVTVESDEEGKFICIYRLFNINSYDNTIIFSGTGMMFGAWYIFEVTMDVNGDVVITNKKVT